MMRIAFLGLGRMGAPMAKRLVDAGHDVVVWNRTPASAVSFPAVAEGAVSAVTGADLVFTMLADAQAVREVVFASGAAKALRPDAVYVDMGTIGVRAARRLHESVERATLDAPVGEALCRPGRASSSCSSVVTYRSWTVCDMCWRCSATCCVAAGRGPDKP